MIALGRGALLALGLLLLAASACAQGITPRTVVLGQSAPLSGPQRALGEQLRAGALAHLRTLNDAGGVHGRRVELATLDDGGDPARALANTRRFIDELGVFVLFGYPEANVTRELLALLQKARVPLFAPASGAALARQPGRDVYTVRAGRAEELERVVDHYAQLGLKRFALVRRADDAGAEFLAAARETLARRGLAPPADVLLKNGEGPLGAIWVADPEVVLVALAQPPAAQVVRALLRDGRRAQIVVLSPADPAQLARALGDAGAGVALSQVVPPLERVSLPVVAEYRAAIEAETGGTSYAPASLEAYIAARVLAEALRRAGPKLTREALLLALEAMTYHDAGGYVVGFSRTQRQGSARNYLLSIRRDGSLLH